MKIFVAHARNFDFQNELYEPLRQSEINKTHTFFFPHEGSVETKTKDIIKNSDIVIAETSYPATGMGIELGWADAFDIPIFAFYKEGSIPSRSAQFVTRKSTQYKDVKELVAAVEQTIQTHNK
jgi:hypothetical protein